MTCENLDTVCNQLHDSNTIDLSLLDTMSPPNAREFRGTKRKADDPRHAYLALPPAADVSHWPALAKACAKADLRLQLSPRSRHRRRLTVPGARGAMPSCSDSKTPPH